MLGSPDQRLYQDNHGGGENNGQEYVHTAAEKATICCIGHVSEGLKTFAETTLQSMIRVLSSDCFCS